MMSSFSTPQQMKHILQPLEGQLARVKFVFFTRQYELGYNTVNDVQLLISASEGLLQTTPDTDMLTKQIEDVQAKINTRLARVFNSMGILHWNKSG